MDTTAIMQTALRLAGMERIPADSGIWYPGRGIKRVLFSIDGGAPELILAKSHGYDALIAHHPVGGARLRFPEVVSRHEGFMTDAGVPRRLAKAATEELVTRMEVRAHPTNYLHDPEVAKLLRFPFMNIHLPIDQVTRDFLLSYIKRARAETVGELVSSLELIPEFRRAETRVELRMGEADSRLGKWVLVFAAGTNGGYPVAKAYFENGVDTVIYLHVDADELAKLKKDCRGNLIVLGHMAGDSIGVNIFLEELGRRGVSSETLGVVRRS